MADVELACPQCHGRWFVPAAMAYGPTAATADVAERRAKRGNRFARKRRRAEVGVMYDQAAVTAGARRCPSCGAGGVQVGGVAPPSTGWWPDPQAQAAERWWDGTEWTPHTR